MPSSYAEDVHVDDYSAAAAGHASTFLELYRPGAATLYPTVVYAPDIGAAFDGELAADRDGLAFLLRAAGLAVAKVSYHQPADTPAGVFGTDPPGAGAPEVDLGEAVQYLRLNQAALFIDDAALLGWGERRGANAIAWSSLGPDHADGGGNPQEQQSTRLKGAALSGAVAYWQAMVQATTAATDFSATATDKLADIATALQDAASPALYGDHAANAGVPHLFLHAAPSESTVLAPPYPTDTISALDSAWHGEALLALLKGHDATFHGDRSRQIEVQEILPAALAQDRALDWLLWQAGRMPVEELVMRAIEDRLRQITHANGYATDVRDVFRWEDVAGAARVYPAIMTTSLRSDYDAERFSTKSGDNLRLGLTLLNRGFQRQEVRSSQFVADVRKALGEYSYWAARQTASRYGIGAPWWVHVSDGARFVEEVDAGARSGATCIVDVRSRTAEGDPYEEVG